MSSGNAALALREQVSLFVGADWSSPPDVHRPAVGFLQWLRDEPGLLRDLVAAASDDEHLAGLAESRHHGLKLVLYDDPNTGFRIRLHFRHAGAASMLHSHRWPFTTLILSGGYRHEVFGDEERFAGSDVLPDALAPDLVSDERAGACYSMSPSLVHAIEPWEDTLSVILRGPSLKRRSFRADPVTRAINWKYGAREESTEKLTALRVPRDAFTQTASMLAALGI